MFAHIQETFGIQRVALFKFKLEYFLRCFTKTVKDKVRVFGAAYFQLSATFLAKVKKNKHLVCQTSRPDNKCCLRELRYDSKGEKFGLLQVLIRLSPPDVEKRVPACKL